MKIKSTIYTVLLAGLLLTIMLNCKKETIKTAPTVSISGVSNITSISVSSGGDITADGGAAITAKGVCWSINQSPTTSDSKTSNGSGTGSFTGSITGLTPGATYNIRAYAINSVGTGYSSQTTFTTLALAPVLTTADLSQITATTVTGGGNITNDGGSSVTARGVCWSKSQNPTTADPKTTDGTGTGSFMSAIAGLTPGTTYYFRAYATNGIGTAYGNQVTAITTATLSTLTTAVVSAITSTTATSGGNITSDGGAPITARGVCWNTSSNPITANNKTTDGAGTGSFTSSITGLTPGATYYIKAYATNSIGTAYGNELTLTAAAISPVLTTGNISNITATTAVSSGNITTDGGSPVTVRGVCWSISSNPTILNSKTTDGAGTGSFTSSITGLTPGVTYYVRAYATNNIGTSYGNDFTITTTAILPVLSTSNISTITSTTAISGGNITTDGGSTVTARGVCWSASSNPTILNSKTTDGAGTGSFTSAITGLTPGTTYYIRAYATNSIGTAYGAQVTAAATAILPTLTTTAVSAATATTATSGGNITSDGGASVTIHGVCWGTSQNPTIANNKTTDGAGTGSFTSSVTGLTAGTTYYVRAYAINSQGTAYGSQETFTTSLTLSLATITTTAASVITFTGATLGGNVTSDGNATVTERGVVYATTQNPTTSNTKLAIGTGTGSFTTNVTGLTAGTTYYVRAYAINSQGTAYGTQETFTTSLTLSLATVTTTAVSAITTAGATLGGNVISDGNATVTERGIVYATTQNPTTSNTKLAIGTGTGSFNSNVTGLTAGTTYYVRAYAINSQGTAYGTQQTFTTSLTLSLATVTTTAASAITTSGATLGGNVTSDGNATATERGIVYATTQNPTTSNTKLAIGTGTGSYTSNITGLTAGTTYYARAYAINSQGTAYGSQVTFSTSVQIQLPTLTTTDATAITTTSATSGGNITSDGNSTVTARGICWSTTQNPTIVGSKTNDGSGSGIFNSNMSVLTPGTTYYIRAYATNSVGTAYGNQISMATTAVLPSVTTNVSVTNITISTATSGGNITSDGGAAVTVRGTCWSTSQNPTINDSKTTYGSGIGSFNSSLTLLVANTTYYLRAYATNSIGTAYGSQVSFKTLPSVSEIVTDVDGNIYHTVTIGTQVWLVENLRTTKYRDGTSIPYLSDNNTWSRASITSSPGFCWYNNDVSNKNSYGALYNGYTINTEEICPLGWHRPSMSEWNTLTTLWQIEGVIQAGGKLKEAGTIHWKSPNNATNASGFTALPGGYRGSDGSCQFINYRGYWWSSTPSQYAWEVVGMYYDGDTVGRDINNGKSYGNSIRCIRD